MKQLLNAYRFFNLLSIDIAGGAVVGAAFFARILQVDLYFQAYGVLALTVWIIYTADHLLDAWRLQEPASTDRHRLHQQHFKVLLALVMIAAALDFVLALFIRPQVTIPGMVMAAACGLYLVLNRWMRYAKELMGTLLYSSGVVLPSLSLHYDLDPHQWTLVVGFVFVVAINMLLFARMSYAQDVADGQQSFVTLTGPAVTRVVIIVLFLSLAATMMLPVGPYFSERLILMVMAAVLLLIFLFPGYFALKERYRLVGDAVFLLPGILFLFDWAL